MIEFRIEETWSWNDRSWEI